MKKFIEINLEKGRYHRNNSHLSSVLASYQFATYQQSSVGRKFAESAVKRIFRKVYNADICDFLPLLITAEKDHHCDAVIGLRSAGKSSLYLEHYLDNPIELEAKQRHNLIISRNKMVEIGNLVSTKAGVSRQLFIVLAFALAEVGIEWVCFTATPQIEQLLQKLAFQPIELCIAQQQLVVNSHSTWGSYYAQVPKVNIGNVQQAVTTLKQSPVINTIYPSLKSIISDMAVQLRAGLLL